ESMAGPLMRAGEIDVVIVGADRIAANGDTANKIGTYTVAVLAHEHRIPFYRAAPISTIDLATPDGDAIPIEERDQREVTHLGSSRLTPVGAKIRNPAFDVTPHRYIAGMITERGIFTAPYPESLKMAHHPKPASRLPRGASPRTWSHRRPTFTASGEGSSRSWPPASTFVTSAAFTR